MSEYCKNCKKLQDRIDELEGTGQTVPLDSLVGLPMELVEDLRDYLWELRGERDWWKDEPRLTYQKDYAKMTTDIEQLNEIIEQANEKA